MFNLLVRPPARSSPPCTHKGRSARVLIVLESKAKAVVRELASLFESWGHVVQIARTWDDGLRQAKAATPDVVVVDRGSRQPGSLQPVRLMRLLPGLKTTPIIVLRNRMAFLLGEGPARSGGAEPADLQPLETEALRSAVGQSAA